MQVQGKQNITILYLKKYLKKTKDIFYKIIRLIIFAYIGDEFDVKGGICLWMK